MADMKLVDRVNDLERRVLELEGSFGFLTEQLKGVHRSILPMHPGELLREDVLPALGITQTEAARHLGISRQSLHEILTEKRAVTPEMAVRLGKLCGNGPNLWATLQSKYDVWKAQETLDVRSIPTLEARI